MKRHGTVVSVTLLSGLLLAAWSPGARAQFVGVTLSFDTNRIAVGGSTTLRVYAQVVPAFRADADRIFSWYLDVLNTNGASVTADFDAQVRPASDNDPLLSSAGTTEGAHRRGIHDTFLNLPGAGTSNRVELLSIPVVGVAPGQTRMRVQAGTGSPLLSADFIVAPKGGGAPWIGGEYSAAFADLTVEGEACDLDLHIAPLTGSGSPGERLALTFTPCPGYDHTVYFRDALGGGTWQALPGAPHNTGSVTVTNNRPHRFYLLGASRSLGIPAPELSITRVGAGGPGQTLQITYDVAAGNTYTLEYRDTLSLAWQPLPGGPHNAGSVTVTNALPTRFYRLKVTQP